MAGRKKSAARLHQTLVEMIRDKPPFALALAEVGGATLPAGATATSVGEAVAPVRDYLPDAVIAIHDATGALHRILIAEVQLETDARKAFSMPVYQALARARHEAPCEVMVITPAKSVAAWLAEPIELGGGSRFCARIVGPDELLRLRAARRAHVDITVEVAFVRAVAHGGRDPRLVTTAGFVFDAMLPVERAALYFDVILDALPISKRRALESFMEKESLQLRSWYFKKLARKASPKVAPKGCAARFAPSSRRATFLSRRPRAGSSMPARTSPCSTSGCSAPRARRRRTTSSLQRPSAGRRRDASERLA